MLEIACEAVVIPNIQLKIKVPSEVCPTAAGSTLHAQYQATNNQHFDTRSLFHLSFTVDLFCFNVYVFVPTLIFIVLLAIIM